MDFVEQVNFFDPFICNNRNCTAKASDQCTILNCFHSVCNSHVKAENELLCSNEECFSMYPRNPEFIKSPAVEKRCENPLNAKLAVQVEGLYSIRQNNLKCFLCDNDDGSLEFCTQCPSVLCRNDKVEKHDLIHSNHYFADLSQTDAEILRDVVKATRNGSNPNFTQEITEIIDGLKRNRDLIDNSLLNFEKCMREVHENTRKLIDETDDAFEQLIRQIVEIKKDLLEKLEGKSNDFLGDLEEKSDVLQFKSRVTNRALVLASFIKNSGLKISPNFIEMFSNNSLAFNPKLFMIPQIPIEHINTTKVLRKVSNELQNVHSIQGYSSSEHVYPIKYWFCEGKQPNYYDITQPISSEKLNKHHLFCFQIFGLSVCNFNLDASEVKVTYCNKKEQPWTIQGKKILFPINDKDNKPCKGVFQIDLDSLRKKGGNKRIEVINVVLALDNSKSNPIKFNLCVVCPNPKYSISKFSIKPGYLTGIANSEDKLFSISKNGKEILKFDASQEIILQQMDQEFDLELKSKRNFGYNHFMEPKGIFVLQDLVFVSDCGYHVIHCFSDDGSFIDKFGRPGRGRGQFNKPMGLSGDQENGELVIADHGNRRIQILLLGNSDWKMFDVKGEMGQRTAPIDVKLDTLGCFCILTQSGTILMHNKNHTFSKTILPEGSISRIMPFFALDRNDVIYFCSEEDKSVYMLKQSSEGVYNLKRNNCIPRTINPVGITVDDNCRLYITHNEPIDTNSNPTSSLVYVISETGEAET